MPEPNPTERRSARVLLVDRAGRILLLRFMFDPAKPELGYGWSTPGGGVNDGEPLPQAAARELHEEVRLAVPAHALGDPVAFIAGYADLGWLSGHFRDDFFYCRVDGHDVDTSGMEALERSNYAGHRWWTLDELASTTEIVYPLELATLLADLLAGRIPRQPVRLPWHH
jgi:8-oxo-dGTP pyrophosphatase MutT (NUDIX family)